MNCCHCGKLTPKSPRHKNQAYCGATRCQRARKAAWQRNKIQRDSDYRFNQVVSNQKWITAHPGYWKRYRLENPEKTERNRILQRIRNRRRASNKTAGAKMDAPPIAKMDASTSRKASQIKVDGEFWLVPVIAKMDASKVYIREITRSYD